MTAKTTPDAKSNSPVEVTERMSSVQIETRATGLPSVTVKVYQGASLEEMTELSKLALSVYYRTRKAIRKKSVEDNET